MRILLAPRVLLAGLALVASAPVAGCLAARPLIPSLVVRAYVDRAVGSGSARQDDRGIVVGWSGTSRTAPARLVEPESPPRSSRVRRLRCAAPWTCAWERVRVAEAVVALESVR